MSTFRSAGVGQGGGGPITAARRHEALGRADQRGDPMTILKRAGGVLVASAALAGLIGLGAGSAIAAASTGTAATWTVKPGGAITAKAGVTTLTDTKTGSKLTCQSSSGKGSLKSGKGLSGTGIGSITALSFSTCTGPLNLTFTVKTT